MKAIFILLALTAIFASCNSTEHLHDSGTYTIKERDGDVTQFFEVKGKYNIVSDTLKKNDKIFINVIKPIPFKKSSKLKNELANAY